MVTYDLFLIGHLIGLIFGLGGATFADLFSLRALRAGRFSQEAYLHLTFVSFVVWVGLTILVLSGAGMIISHYLLSGVWYLPAKLLAKLILVGILIINGIVIHRSVLPVIAQAVDQPIHKTDLARHSRLFAMTAAISFISWWSTFTLGAWRSLPFELPTILLGYTILLASGLIVSLSVVPRIFGTVRASKNHHPLSQVVS